MYISGKQYVVAADPPRNIANFPAGGGCYHGPKNPEQARTDDAFFAELRNAAPALLADWLRMREALEKIAACKNYNPGCPTCVNIARAALHPAPTA